MDDIIQLAEKLGKAIAASKEAVNLRQVREAVSDEPGLAETLQEFGRQSEKVAALEAENKPVEVDDKHKLRELNDKLVANDLFKKYTAAQVDYVDMMRKVNEALQSQLADGEPAGD